MNRILLILAILFFTNNLSAQKCNACFTATPDPFLKNGYILDASCSDSSVTTYTWLLDGANIISLPFPFYQINFAKGGIHTITLITSNANNCNDSTTKTVGSVSTCNASIVQTMFGINTVYFSASTSPYSSTAQFKWNFGDGTSLLGGSSVQHTYPNITQNYVACVYVIDSSNPTCNASDCDTVQIFEQKPNVFCNAFFNATFLTKDTLKVNGSYSKYDTSNYLFEYYVENVLVQNSKNISYTFTIPNTPFVTILLKITDTNGVLCSQYQDVILNNSFTNNCSACFIANATAGSNTLVNVDASCSVSSVPITTYNWLINGVYTVSSTIPQSVLNVLPVGKNEITLIVSGPGCTDSSTQYVSVAGYCDSSFFHYVTNNGVSFYKNNYSPTATYIWNFGDGTPNQISASPYHYYSSAGTYTVCLTIIDSALNCFTNSCNTVTILPTNCNAQFYTYNTGTNAYQFNTLNYSFNPSVTFAWNFGDGTNSSSQFANHIYALPGVYPVCLTITDTTFGGCTNTFCDTVTVKPLSCNAAFNIYNFGGNNFQFNTVQYSYTPSTQFLWTFGDGDTSNLQFPNHLYANNNPYNVCLKITDTAFGGCSTIYCDSVNPVNTVVLNCKACFTATPSKLYPMVLDIDASCSSPSNSYSIFVDGVLSNISYTPITTIYISSYGTHNIQLVTQFNSCSDTVVKTINVPYACKAQISNYSLGNSEYVISAYSAAVGSSVNYNWSFGDGVSLNTTTNSTQHKYLKAGNYLACVTVTDTSFGGCSSTSCDSIIVPNIVINNPTNCNAIFYANNLMNNSPVSINASNSAYDSTNYLFQFAVNNIVLQTSTNPLFTYQPTSNNYDFVLLTITDTLGNVCSKYGLNIQNMLTVSNCYSCFYLNPLTINGDSINLNASCASIKAGYHLVWKIDNITMADTSTIVNATLSNPGLHTVTLLIVDSAKMVCDSSTQQTFVFQPNCNSCLTVSNSTNNDYTFNASCSKADSNALYIWSINNNLVASVTNDSLNYTFTQSGNYLVCLTIYNSATKTYCNQACTNVLVTSSTQTSFDICGSIWATDSMMIYNTIGKNEAVVYLIADTIGGQLTALDSTHTNAYGQYCFNNIAPGTYRVKAALKSTSSLYNYNIPTYYQSSEMWFNANPILVNNYNQYNVDIFMTAGTNLAGTGNIAGSLTQGTARTKVDVKLDGISMMLVNANTNKVLDYSKTSINGSYSFNNLPVGNYKVYGECLNMNSIPATCNITPINTSINGANFEVNSTIILPLTNTVLSINFIEAKGRFDGKCDALSWKVNKPDDVLSYVVMKIENNRSTVIANTSESYYNNCKTEISRTNTYQIKVVLKNGKIVYSNLIVLNRNINNDLFVNLFPNPVKDQTSLQINLQKPTTITIKLIDQTGRLLNVINTLGKQGMNTVNLDISKYAKGMYILQICNQEKVIATKQLIKN